MGPVEPVAKGAFDLGYVARLDTMLDLAAARGVRPVLVVLGTPAWARHGAGTRLTPPDRVEDYGDMLGFLAARYTARLASPTRSGTSPTR